MKLRYIGPFSAAEVHTGLYDVVIVERGETADVPDHLAVQLVDQVTNWELADDAPASKRSTKKDGE